MLYLSAVVCLFAEPQITFAVLPHGIGGSGCTSQGQLTLEGVLAGLADEGGSGVAIDPTQRPPTHLGRAGISFICCPLVGLVALYHALQVRAQWAKGHFTRARVHSLLSKKIAGNAVGYGVVLIALYIFVFSGKQKQPP
jgi:hypothetical protein